MGKSVDLPAEVSIVNIGEFHHYTSHSGVNNKHCTGTETLGRTVRGNIKKINFAKILSEKIQVCRPPPDTASSTELMLLSPDRLCFRHLNVWLLNTLGIYKSVAIYTSDFIQWGEFTLKANKSWFPNVVQFKYLRWSAFYGLMLAATWNPPDISVHVSMKSWITSANLSPFFPS